MSKYDKFRNLIGNGQLNWPTQPITCAAIAGYTYNAAHASLADVQAAGGSILASSKLSSKALLADGTAQSSACVLNVLPAGGPYDIILFTDINNVTVPIVFYDNVVTMASTGDVLVRPAGSSGGGLGSWLRF